MSPSPEFVNRILQHNEKLAAQDAAIPTHTRPAKAIGSMTVEEAKAESRRLAATNPALVAARAKGKARKQHAQTAAERRAAEVRAFALANEAMAAHDDAAAWETDEETYEDFNPKWENLVAALLDIGEPATEAVRKLWDAGYDVESVAELVQQRDALRAQADLLEEGRALVEETAEVGKKLEARLKRLVELNDWLNPEVHQAEAARLRDQLTTGGATGPDRIRIGKMAEEADLKAEAAANALADAVTRWREMGAQMPGGVWTDFDLAEEALIGSMNITASFVNAEHDADLATKALRARADAENIGADSRDAHGRLVLMPPSGTGDALYVNDGDAGALIAQGYRLIRDDVPVQMPDLANAFYPAPTAEQVANDLVAEINEKDATADDRALADQIAWLDQAPSRDGQAAEAEARAKANHAAILREKNTLR